MTSGADIVMSHAKKRAVIGSAFLLAENGDEYEKKNQEDPGSFMPGMIWDFSL